MKLLFSFKYPKIIILIFLVISAYYVFRNPAVGDYISNMGNDYTGFFIAGMLFAFGFTAPFAAGFFVASAPSNLLLAGVIGGLGALASDLIIFSIIRFSFKDEFNRLKNTKTAKRAAKLIEKNLGKKIKIYLMYVFAGILIASPLPDEAGIVMLAGLTKINSYALAKISFFLNTAGIMVLLAI